MYEQNGTATSNAPWTQTTYTYDDYATGSGLSPTGYHNVLQTQTSSSNAPTTTTKSSYTIHDATDSGNNYVYYTVNTVKHKELDDASGHIWQCSDISYDEGVSGVKAPAAGWPTTVKTYSNCNSTPTASTTLTNYTGYDLFGNIVGTVDAFGAANSTLYASAGCQLATAPVVLSSSWTAGRYTSCTVYDSYGAQATSQQNALGQSSSVAFDDTSGRLPTSSTDPNGQTLSVSYSITNQNQGLQDKEPGETGTYTTTSNTNSTCVFTSKRPCYEIDSASALYAGAISRTFYDAEGRAVETRTPLDATHDLVSFTVHNEWNDSTFVSQPFRVASGSSWIDPNGATDDTGTAPTGTISISDPLGRVIATRDPIEGTSAEPGITCGSGNVTGTWTTCVGFGLGSPDPNSGTQDDYRIDHDANNHMTATFVDALGRSRFIKVYSVSGGINSNITSVTETQYNALNLPTAVIVTDSAPQNGQSVTSVTTTTSYDDQGRAISVADPDRGTQTYTYDADNRLLTVVSGSHTVGTSYDLLGRTRCIQDAAPTTDGSGTCSSGSHPLVQNTYDSSPLHLSGATNYSVGRLGQSVATTYYTDGSSVASTEQFAYDQRGRLVASTEQLSVPSSWNVTTALPIYQEQTAYNNANQPTTTQTTAGGAAGSTFTQVYDGTTGLVTGLSNNTTGAANLASLSYEQHGLVSDLNFLVLSGGAAVNLVNDHLSYDGDLRPVGTTATWQQSGSGTTGIIFSSNRSYDPVGNVSSLSTTHATVTGQSGSGGSSTENFCYDEENRLVWAGNSGTQPAAGTGTCGNATIGNGLGGAGYSTSDAYTHLGQIWQAPLNGAGASQQYLYCDSTHPHQLTGVFPAGATCSNEGGASYTLSYDAWGNVSSRATGTSSATLSYTVLNQLMQWNSTDSSNTANNRQEWYAYDASGNRVLRRNSSGGTTGLTTYPFGLEEHSYGASGTSSSNTYYYSLAGHLVASSDGTNIHDLLTDALGSVLATVSATLNASTVLGNQLYGPYGNQRYSKGSMGTSKGFTGQYSDGTGLDYFNARYYDPVVGLFLSVDSVQGNEQGMDPYAYVGNNPESRTDPSGQRFVDDSIGQNDSGSSNDTTGGSCNSATCSDGSGFSFPNPTSPVVTQQGGGGSQQPTPTDNSSSSDTSSSDSSSSSSSSDNNSSAPSVSQVTQALTSVAGVAGTILFQAVDLIFNFSGMWKDIQTITDNNASFWARAAAVADLGFTIFTDINMLDGEGEAARAAEVGAEIVEKGAADVEEKGMSEVAGCALSFTPTTPVTTDHGKQAIGTLQPGEKVLAYNPETGKMELQPIVHVWINHDNDLVDLTLGTTTATSAKQTGKAAQQNSEVIHTTSKHPFLTVEKGFLPVGQIKLHMHVREGNGQIGVVTGWNVVPGVQVMYNLEVAQDHTFTVGAGLWVVHNCADSKGIRSLIGTDNRLIKAAEKAGKDQSIQRDIDNMTQRLLQGGDPGKEQGSLTKGISYLRSQNGARIFYRVRGGTYEILGKSSKANESQVIQTVLELFG